MLAILNTAAQWRPLPDLTFLVIDDPPKPPGAPGYGRPSFRH